MLPRFTIISVVFNAVDDIQKTVESVIQQKYQNLEYIIIDGGSTDGTLEVLDKYRKAGVIKYKSEPDNGIYDAINKGMALASGEFVNILMMGDYHDPEFLEKMNDYLGDFDFAYSGCKCVTLNGEVRPSLPGPLTSIKDVSGMPFAHNTLMVRRQICLNFPYSQRFRYASDFDFICLLLSNRFSGIYIPECLSSYETGGVGNSFLSIFESFIILRKYRQLSFRSIWVLFKQIIITAKVKYL